MATGEKWTPDVARVLSSEGQGSPTCPTSAGYWIPCSSRRTLRKPKLFALPSSRTVLFTVKLVSGGGPRCRPRAPRSPVGPIWPALGELSTGAGNCGVLRARLICISMASLLVDGLLSGRILGFIEPDELRFLIRMIYWGGFRFVVCNEIENAIKRARPDREKCSRCSIQGVRRNGIYYFFFHNDQAGKDFRCS